MIILLKRTPDLEEEVISLSNNPLLEDIYERSYL